MRGLLRHLVTRVYFPDDAANAQDAVLNAVPKDRRATLIAVANPQEPEHFSWDIHLQGERETVFFDT
jgi:protocatechuate 3,4-dioxygenase alpha subunit